MTGDGKALKNKTREITFAHLCQKHTPEQIAEQRHLGITTIYGHLLDLAEKDDYDIDLRRYITDHEWRQINATIKNTPTEGGMKAILEALGGEPYHYGKIRIVQWLNKHKAD